MKKIIGIILGAILIACGVIYVLGAFGIADIKVSLDGWWAFFIILPCANGLLTSKDKFGNFIGLLVGVLLLLAAQNVFTYDVVWKSIVPAVIVMFGIKMIVKSTATQKEKEEPEKGRKESMATFSSRDFDYADEEVTVAKIGAVFGGANCNLTDAKIKDGSQIDLFCVFGGADIIIPENVNVKINTFCMFGGISDKREVKPADKDVTLIINGFCLFGGADIK